MGIAIKRVRPALTLAALAAMLSTIALSQEGVSSASASRARYLGNLGLLPSSREIAVEEIVNYHRHGIGRPKAGEAMHMDVRWGSDVSYRDAVLQIGFSTALANDREQLGPLNLALVIDKSGSMAEADKMIRVKAALGELVSRLRPQDQLSIVVFDSEAQVLLPSRRATHPNEIRDAIARIEPGSATNLHAGLMLGFQQASKAFRRDATNRVILLTDGIANRGVTEPAKIASDALVFNDKGIDLSTIGVGLDLNKDLLRELAKSGRGLFHFVADSEDISKVFVRELQSLLSPIASEPNVTVEFGRGIELAQVYGYDPRHGRSSVSLKLDSMNNGLTQVALLRFRVAPNAPSRTAVNVRLSYYDLKRKKQVVKTEEAILSLRSSPMNDFPKDPEVAKNFTIAELAQAIRDMAAAHEAGRNRDGERLLSAAIAETQRRYPNAEDPDVRRVLDTAIRHRDTLRRVIGEDRGKADEGARPSPEANLIFNGDFSKGNVGFASALPYRQPGYNCLWPLGYTIARTWNDPLLHRLFANAPYPSPESSHGNEQVMYANAGGTESLLMWTASVKCEPNTRYRISFWSISLNGDRERIPTYEIQVNGIQNAKSAPQRAGYGDYAPIEMFWDSGSERSATILIYRMPMEQPGGLIAIAGIKMVRA